MRVQRQARNVAGLLLCAILVIVPAFGATKTPISITAEASFKGITSLNFSARVSFPATVVFSVRSPPVGAVYLWEFGDGTNSTDAVPTHTFNAPSVYPVTFTVTAGNGSVARGLIYLGLFGSTPASAIATFPTSGATGFTSVELSGAFFSTSKQVKVLMNGTLLTTVTSNAGGLWLYNVTSSLPDSPNGTKFIFTTSPPSTTTVFTALEEIRATPSYGGTGSAVLVTGMSYPADSDVMVYVGGASLGSAITDGTGTFVQSFQVPGVAPLTSGGLFHYSTIPPLYGPSGSLSLTASSLLSGPFSFSLWWLVIAFVVITAVLVVRSWRQRRREYQP